MGQGPMRKLQRQLLGVTTTGQPFWTIRGAEGEEDDKNQNETESDSGSADGDNDGDEGAEGSGESSPHGATVSLAEYEALKNRMQAADKNRSAAEKKVKEYEDKDRSDLEKAQRDLKEKSELADKLEKQLAKQTIHNKFLASNKHTWHDPETALALLDMTEVQIEEDGKVTGLEDAIENLAKSKPFLIKDEGGKQDKDEKKNKGGRPSGSQPPSNGSNQNRDTDRDKLLKKYPQLAR